MNRAQYNKVLISAVMIFIISFMQEGYSQPIMLWERFNIAPNNGACFPIDMKLDSNGFIYNLCAEGGFSVYKYDKYGNLIWNIKYIHPGLRLLTMPKSMGVDIEGNVYCTGDNGDEVVTIKIDNSGRLRWVRTYIPGSGFYSSGGLALDTIGNIVVVAGSYSNSSRIIYGVIKYNSEGDTVWNKVKSDISPVRGGIPKDVSVSPDGSIYFAGELNIDTLGTSESRCYTVKLNNEGDLEWLSKYYLRISSLRKILVDSDGNNIYALGGISENQFADVIIIKYSLTGIPVWYKRYDTDEHYSDAFIDATLDRNNNIIFTARSGTFLGKVPFILTVKYSSNGNLLWDRRYIAESSADNIPFGILTDKSNNIYITEDVTMDNLFSNIFFLNLIKYNEIGELQWNILNGTPNRRNTGHKIIKTGDFVYVLGSMQWTNGMFNSILLKYSENPLSISNESEKLNFILEQNYPNPFNPETNIVFHIGYSGDYEIKVFDISGKLIEVILIKNLSSGIYNINWNAKSNPSGIYFYGLYKDGEKLDMKKMILIK